MARTLDFPSYASDVIRAFGNGGVLLTTKANDVVNCMTIGWGSIGLDWNKPVFTAYIREGRHTVSLLEENPEFTISVPKGPAAKQILSICGSRSGRDVNKVEEAGLQLVEPHVVSVPAVAQLPLTLECRVLYAQAQEIDKMQPDEQRWYPQDKPSTFVGANKDTHIAYYAHIVDAYLL